MPLTPDEAKEVVRLAGNWADAADFYRAEQNSTRELLLRNSKAAFTRYIDQLTEKKP